MPRYRQGRKVALNVYDGDVPVFQAHSIESAAELVELLNIGARSKEFLDAWDMPVGDFLTPPEFPTPPETPPSSPVVASGPPTGTGQPEDDGTHQESQFVASDGTLWRRPFGWSGHWCGFRPSEPCDACFEKVE